MDIESTTKQLKKLKAHRILLQIPEGLKTRAQGFTNGLEKNGFEIFISCEPCFGACDITDMEAKRLHCDAILHVGHTDFGVRSEIPIVYDPYKIEADPIPLLKKHVDKIKKYKSICLVTTLQFLDVINPAKKFLNDMGIQVVLNNNTKSGHLGQLLGCDYSAAIPCDVDAYLYIGSGIFHPLGIALKTDKPVLSLNLETEELEDMTERRDKLRKIKAYHIGVAQDADKFGILLTTKPGQMHLKQAEEIRKKLKSKGKKVYVLVMNQITPEKIMGIDVDVYVNCACPRMDEDFKLFKKPILNPEDVEKI